MVFIIQSIQFQPYRLAFRQPFHTAWGSLDYREGFVIEISDRPSAHEIPHIGLGEASPIVGFGMESLAEAENILLIAQRSLINHEINNIKDIEDLLDSYDRTPAAKHGLELALLNLLAQKQGQTLTQLLINYFGGTVRNQVSINAVIGAISAEKAVIQAKNYLAQGYRCLKIKVGTKDFAADFSRVEAVRSQAGKDIQIRLDANQGWSVEQAIANLKTLDFLQIEYVEQPVIADDLLGMAVVRRSQSIPIAADESVHNLAQLQQIISNQAADIIILKPMALGGILTAHRAAIIAFAAGLDVVITNTIDGAIATQAAFDLAAALPIKRACGLSTGHFGQ
ncbi:o-succinylbenzoate synthase [Pseudanabaena biceps]|nr:o-succinylbenzoate synthase [Pseudanabaena biceps]